MIKDASVLQEVRESWQTVRTSQQMVHRNLLAALAFGALQGEDFKNLSHSFVMLFAFSVLEDVLEQLRSEGSFKSARRSLGHLMEASKDALPWSDYDLIDEGRIKRNHIAHRRRFLKRSDCWRYIDSVESELIAWRILPHAIEGQYIIERSGAT